MASDEVRKILQRQEERERKAREQNRRDWIVLIVLFIVVAVGSSLYVEWHDRGHIEQYLGNPNYDPVPPR